MDRSSGASRSSSSVRASAISDTIRSLNGSVSKRLEDFEDDEEPMIIDGIDDDDLADSEHSNGQPQDVRNVGNDGLHKLLPKSLFVYKYPSHDNPGNGDADFSLIWLVGNIVNSHSPQTLFNKYRKLKNFALKADLRDICEDLERLAGELLQPMALGGRQGTNGFNRFNKIGILMHGLVAVLNLQLRFCKNELQGSYASIGKYGTKESNINLATDSVPRTKQINVSHVRLSDENLDFPGRLDFSDIGAAFGTEGRASPRRAAGGDFFDQAVIDNDNISVPAKSQQRRQKDMKQHRSKPKINMNEIIRRLEDLQTDARANQISEIYLPENNRVDEYPSFDPTVLPPPEETPIVPQVRAEDEPVCAPGDISPQRKKAEENVPPPAPRKVKRAREHDEGADAELRLEPLADLEDRSTKSPRSRRRRTLRFDDETQISNHILRARLGERLVDDDIAKILDSLRARTFIPLEGSDLIEQFGLKIPSTKLVNMVGTYIAHQNIRVETDMPGDSTIFEPEQERQGEGGISDTHFSGASKTYEKTPQELLAEASKPSSGLPAQDDMDRFVTGPITNFMDEVQPMAVGEEHATSGPRKTFDEIIGPNPSRVEAARTFVMLLRMQAQQSVAISQDEPYGTIQVQKL